MHPNPSQTSPASNRPSNPQPNLPPGPDLDTATLVEIFGADPFPLLDQCRDRYGDIFTLPLGDFGIAEHQASGQWVFLTRAEDVKQLLKAGSSVQVAGRANQIQFQKILPDQSSLMLDGPLHQARRKILAKILQAELMTVMLAGVDTTAATLSWSAAQILSRPALLARVREELTRVLGTQPISSASAAQFDQMPVLDAVIYETTRLCPLFFTTTPRLLLSPLSIAGYQLPPCTIVASYMNGIHLRPDYYPDPLAFRPERFIDAKPDPYRYLFFGGGIGRCPGMNFALYEIKVVLATLLYACRFEPVNVNTERERHGSFFAPKDGIVVRLA